MRLHHVLPLILLLLPSAASLADWHVASSEHFVIYADDSERDIRLFAQRLERYRRALDTAFGIDGFVPSPSNRVTIYVVRNLREVRRLLGEGSQNADGFYIPRAGGSLAVIPPLSRASNSDSQNILMHEYAHHFMYENLPYLVPRWYSEGFAEYFATAEFPSEDSVSIGLPAYGRMQNLSVGIDADIEKVLDSKAFAEERGARGGAGLYASSWLLMHYLYSSDEGRRRARNYLARLNVGQPELEAATGAFGDLRQLERELTRHLGQRTLEYWAIQGLEIGTVEVRRLNTAESAVMPVVIRSKVGVNEELAAQVVVQAREIASKFPDAAAVQAALAEAEYDAGNDEAAIAAAERALALNPGNMTALIQKGYALTRIASETGSTEAWTRARQHYVAVNRVENDHPIPLVAYYTNYIAQDMEPTETAILGLERALELAPYDANARMLLTRQYMQEERYVNAIRTIQPLAHNPHIGEGHPALELLAEAEEQARAQLQANASSP